MWGRVLNGFKYPDLYFLKKQMEMVTRTTATTEEAARRMISHGVDILDTSPSPRHVYVWPRASNEGQHDVSVITKALVYLVTLHLVAAWLLGWAAASVARDTCSQPVLTAPPYWFFTMQL